MDSYDTLFQEISSYLKNKDDQQHLRKLLDILREDGVQGLRDYWKYQLELLK